MQPKEGVLRADKLAEATTTNENILSDAEVQHGKRVLAGAKRGISKLDVQIEAQIFERESYQRQEARLRTAFTPHKRIPPELLLEIFSYYLFADSDDEDDHPDSPPRVSNLPWILGQVCSYWRAVSRAAPRFWECIVIDMDKIRGGKLAPACDVLPPVAVLAVKFRPDDRGLENVGMILPYLWRVQELDLCMNIQEYDELWKTAAPHHFSTLRAADFRIQNRYRFRNHQQPQWNTTGLFEQARSLERIKLSSTAKFSTALLSLDLPWSQITCLDISGLAELSTTDIFRALQKCSSLRNFSVSFRYSDDTLTIDSSSHTMPSRHSFVIYNGIPSTLADAPYLWSHLSTLTIFRATFQDHRLLHRIIKLCPRLTALQAPVPSTGLAPIAIGDLVLPHLKALTLTSIRHTWIFTSLITPALTTLDIRFETQLDLSPVRHMVISSRCALSSFNCQGGPNPVFYLEETPTGFHALLAAIPSVITFKCTYSLADAAMLHDIRQGVLLPRVESLSCSSASLETLLDVVEGRLERESLQPGGRIALRKVLVQVPFNFGSDVRNSVQRRVNMLRRKYGIKCDFILR